MAKKNIKSVEEMVEDLFKKQLDNYGVRYYTKNEPINQAIDDALRSAPSKSGGKGANFPDINRPPAVNTLMPLYREGL